MIKRITYFIITIILFGSLFWFLSQPPKNNGNLGDSNNSNAETNDIYKDYPVYDNPDLVFYWGNGCPHCENVEKWLNENNADAKIKVNYKEVYFNQQNQTELKKSIEQYCPELIQNGGIGVPTGFDPINKKCIQGDTPIIDFLSSKLAN